MPGQVTTNMTSELTLAPLHPGDWEQVKDIYLEGIATGNATLKLPHLRGSSGTQRIFLSPGWSRDKQAT